MSNWKEYKFSDFVDINPKVALKKGVEYSFVEMKDLSEGNKFVLPSQKRELKGGSRFENGDTLFARITPCLENGKISQVKGLENGVGFGSTEFLVFRGKEGVSNADFVHYLALSDEVRSFAEQNMVGTSGRQRVSWQAFENLELSLPDLPTQIAIAEILSSLDDKIELNNKINQELENLAQTLFKQWFIDFEFHCLPENYKFSGAVKPLNFESIMTYKRVGGLPAPDGKSWFVYILLCDDNSFYKGMTNDLYRRFYEHYTGVGAEHTKKHQPIKVIHWEQFNTKEDAAKREQELKTGYGRTWISRQVEKAGGFDAISGLTAPKDGSLTAPKDGSLPALQEAGGSPAPKTQLRMAGEMVDSELGEIPKGWNVGNLNQIAKLLKKNKKPFENPDTIYHHYSLPEFDSGKMPSMELGEKILSSKYQVLKHSILVSKLNPRIPRIWTIIKPNDNSICSTEFQVLKPLEDVYFPFVNCLCSSDGYINSIQSKVTGTSSSHQRVNPKDIINYEMVLPPLSIVNQFYDSVYDSLNLIDDNRKENQELTNLRDTLLPKLISGELEVADIMAEKA